ncbi:hypothetical protein EMIHUDRAFT_219940 [Emiliania huxleyi CCMP1516]|uniref:Syntaxin N-terminal domain-containing protein n=2 Tax=Emiliania huxleyi TaxID=2903 RepID=A0A0D3I3I3_EMIH1|nr:hypothetical protein EMIHUDRAFT_219940 [Emiliania huxleyi CCMP1516]EOD05818.1 hypothetical protein EMIHUDRAFT_219940 [Emiliania huxleyi CCMP1516]|eukprot:XP_005758247.1 hypothetical protein EMIHUDRAFT_219940 [Emiliania huxleyi CCMP1516]
MTLSREKDVLASVCTVASAVERLEAACSRFKALGESSAIGAPADTADLQCSLARGRDQLSALESTLRALHSSRQVVAVAPTPAELQPPCVDVTYSDGGRRVSAAGRDASGRSGGPPPPSPQAYYNAERAQEEAYYNAERAQEEAYYNAEKAQEEV